PEEPGAVRGGLSAFLLRAPGARLARRGLRRGGAGASVPPQCRSVPGEPRALMDLGLKDKIAIVGGGSDGIGLGIALALAGEGSKLAIFARREAGLARAADAIRAQTGAEVLAISADGRAAERCSR